MVIVIDAYNMLKQKKTDYIDEHERQQFIAKLLSYAKRKQHAITVVFDGGTAERPEKLSRGRVTIIYSGHRASADDVINEIIPDLTPHHSILVTSDRALRTFANQHRIHSIEPMTFNTMIEELPYGRPTIVKSSAKPRKLSEHSNEELDTLMEQASTVILYKDEQPPEEHKKQPQNTLSKSEKALSKILKKL